MLKVLYTEYWDLNCNIATTVPEMIQFQFHFILFQCETTNITSFVLILLIYLEIACTLCGASCRKCWCIALHRWYKWIWISKTANEIMSRWICSCYMWWTKSVSARLNRRLPKLPKTNPGSKMSTGWVWMNRV